MESWPPRGHWWGRMVLLGCRRIDGGSVVELEMVIDRETV
jgi:hypothetical protein